MGGCNVGWWKQTKYVPIAGRVWLIGGFKYNGHPLAYAVVSRVTIATEWTEEDTICFIRCCVYVCRDECDMKL